MKFFLFKAYFRFISVIFPTLAAKQAKNIMLTPKLKKFNNFLPNSDEVLLLNSDTTVNIWHGTKGTVLLMHGWSSSSDDFLLLFNLLKALNYRIVAPIPAGHQNNHQKRSNPIKFMQSITDTFEATAHNFPIDFAIGHSMGASAISFALAFNERISLKKVVLISPAVSFTNVLLRFSNAIGFSKKASKKFLNIVDKEVGVTHEDLNLTDTLLNCSAESLLIHDILDKEVPMSEVVALKEILNLENFLFTTGFGHRRILKSEEVNSKIIQFIDG